MVEVENFDAVQQLGENGKRFKIAPQRLLYSLQWLQKGKPAEFHLALVRDPDPWFAYVATMLLGELNRREPHLFDKPRGRVVAKSNSARNNGVPDPAEAGCARFFTLSRPCPW
jgi:hypothetical protein